MKKDNSYLETERTKTALAKHKMKRFRKGGKIKQSVKHKRKAYTQKRNRFYSYKVYVRRIILFK